MSKLNPIISEYIANSADFAQPILIELRAIVHSYCPEVSEEIKWNFPNFVYKGSILCHMASFKQHCTFGFWLASLMKDEHGVLLEEKEGMGQLGKIRSLEEVPASDKLGGLVLQAMALIDAGVKLPKKAAPAAEKKLDIPQTLTDELEKHPAAKSVFDNFSFSHKREYVEWLNEAKTEATLNKRLDKTISNLLESKSKEWKYRK